jgi:hypothetical protein
VEVVVIKDVEIDWDYVDEEGRRKRMTKSVAKSGRVERLAHRLLAATVWARSTPTFLLLSPPTISSHPLPPTPRNPRSNLRHLRPRTTTSRRRHFGEHLFRAFTGKFKHLVNKANDGPHLRLRRSLLRGTSHPVTARGAGIGHVRAHS